MAKTYLFACEECGETFTAGRKDKRFCSESCMVKAAYRRKKGAELASARKDKPCAQCGHPFTARRSDARYCSEPCRSRAYEEENREALNAQRRARVQANPERRKAALARFAERHPDNGKQRYARIKADPERIAAERARTRQYYRDHKDEALERSKRQRERMGTKLYNCKHGCDWDELIARLWKEQDGKCYLCGSALDRNKNLAVHLDHDHSCCRMGYSCEACRRGLACVRCNHLIGRVKDDPDLLRRIADNLEAAMILVRERMKEADLTKRGILFDLDEPA